jgi:hypothetical protein
MTITTNIFAAIIISGILLLSATPIYLIFPFKGGTYMATLGVLLYTVYLLYSVKRFRYLFALLFIAGTAISAYLFGGLITTLWGICGLWTIRSFNNYNSIGQSLMDLVISIFATLFALWTLSHTTSLITSLWAFFLAQSLVALITDETKQQEHLKPDRFSEAVSSAEMALKRIVIN